MSRNDSELDRCYNALQEESRWYNGFMPQTSATGECPFTRPMLPEDLKHLSDKPLRRPNRVRPTDEER